MPTRITTTTTSTRARRVCAALAAMTLAVGACGGDEGADDATADADATAESGDEASSGDDPAGDDPSGGDVADGSFTGELETGVEIAAELWVPATDPDLAEIEAWRERTGAGPVTYGRMTLTNDTDAPDNGRFLTLTGPDGDVFADDTVEASFLCSEINNWWEESPDRDQLVEEYTAIIDELCDGNFFGGPTVEPGATVSYWVAVRGEAPEFSRVYAGLGNELTR